MSVSHSPQHKATNNQREEEEEEGRNIEEELAQLRREREELEKLRAEIEKTRTIGVASGTRSRSKKNTEKNNGGANDNVIETERRVVSGIINHMQNLQIDVKIDKFSDENHKNPIEFLEAVDKYFRFREVNEEHKLIVCESFLEGRAKVWGDTVSNTCQTYAEFKSKFLNEFYSIPIQVKLKNQWLSRRYKSQEGALQDYFYKQIRAARYIEPEMSTYEINYSIARQFPARIREALCTVDYSSTAAMAQGLAQLELIQKERETERRRYPYEDERNYHNRNGPANVRVIQASRWRDFQPNYYKNRLYEGRRYDYQGYRARGGPYDRRNYYDRRDTATYNHPDTRFPPPTVGARAGLEKLCENNCINRNEENIANHADSNNMTHLN